MPPEERDAAHLLDMMEYGRRVVRAVGGLTLEAYLGDVDRQMIVERGIEVIGEAANRVSSATRSRHPEIRWRGIIDQRHVLAHDYGRIEQRKLWAVATVHVPVLLQQLERVVPPPPPPSNTSWEDSR
jgi:uncharacterized protein with HEPN domain